MAAQANATPAESVHIEEVIGVKSDKALLDSLSLPDLTNEVTSSAFLLTTLLDGLAHTLIGEEARMSTIEAAMIRQPLERMLKRFGTDQLEFIGKYTDPFLLVMAMVAWGKRISNEIDAKRKRDQPPAINRPEEHSVPAARIDPLQNTGAPEAVSNLFTSQSMEVK